MPIHDFTCRSCGKTFDKFFRSMPKHVAADCPHCGSSQTQRGLSKVQVGTGGRPFEASPDAPMCGRCGVPGGPCVSQ